MNFRRYYILGSAVFITQVVQDREPVFRETQYVNLLRETLRKVKELHPFTMLGYVFLSDHFHLLIQPTGESNFSDIMHSFKPNFTKEYKKTIGLSSSQSMKFWQKRFWDHVIRMTGTLKTTCTIFTTILSNMDMSKTLVIGRIAVLANGKNLDCIHRFLVGLNQMILIGVSGE